jgi:CO dehydrogenase maturation factor
MEAGLEHLGRGTTAYIDALIVVVEPGRRSFQTASQVKKLSRDIGIKRLYIVGNKVADENDFSAYEGAPLDVPFLGRWDTTKRLSKR